MLVRVRLDSHRFHLSSPMHLTPLELTAGIQQVGHTDVVTAPESIENAYATLTPLDRDMSGSPSSGSAMVPDTSAPSSSGEQHRPPPPPP